MIEAKPERGTGTPRHGANRSAKAAAIAARPITEAEIAAWFDKIRPGWKIDQASLVGLAWSLELLRQHDPDGPPEPGALPDPKTWKGTRAAIMTLEKSLPKFIGWARQRVKNHDAANWDDGINLGTCRLAAFFSLLDAANEARTFVEWSARPTRDEPWRDHARMIEKWIRLAWGPAAKNAGISNPTSPIVRVVRCALLRIGVPKTHAAIIEALRARKG